MNVQTFLFPNWKEKNFWGCFFFLFKNTKIFAVASKKKTKNQNIQEKSKKKVEKFITNDGVNDFFLLAPPPKLCSAYGSLTR